MKCVDEWARWAKRALLALCAAVAVFAAPAIATAAPPSVALVTGTFYTPDFRNVLADNGVSVTEITNYTAASLAPYSHVVHYGNSFTDMTALTTYVQNGGTLIEQPWFWTNHSPPAALQIFGGGSSEVYSGAYPGVTVLDAGNPLLAGVTFPPAGGFNIGRISDATFAAGVTPVANWADGAAMIGTKPLGAGKVIGINLHVITSDTAYQVIHEPWATQLYLNAVGRVPEPASATLLGMGTLVAAGLRRRSKCRQLCANQQP